jgi:hypothetical protein
MGVESATRGRWRKKKRGCFAQASESPGSRDRPHMERARAFSKGNTCADPRPRNLLTVSRQLRDRLVSGNGVLGSYPLVL